MKPINKSILLLTILPSFSIAKGVICISNTQFTYTNNEWIKNNRLLKRKNSNLAYQRLTISYTNPDNLTIKPISDSDVQQGLGEKRAWYLGGVSGTSGPALLVVRDGFSIYETTDSCGISYKNGMTGTGLCYIARMIGKSSDLEIHAGAIAFEEIYKASNIYKTRSLKEFRKITHSVSIGCQ